MPDLSEIKTILRSLLISKGSRDVTIRQLNGLYREMEDCNIPFRDFNYSNLEEFLRSIPDTLRLRPNRDYEMCVYHVDTEKTAHVSSLVARQKKPPRRAKSACSYRPRTNYYHHPRPAQNTYKPLPNSILSQVLQELKNSTTRVPNCGIRKFDILSRVREKMHRNAQYTVEDLNFQLREFLNKLIIENDFIYFKDEFEKSKMSNQVIEQPVVSSNRNITGLVNGCNENKNVNSYNRTGSANSHCNSKVIDNCNGTNNNVGNLNKTDKVVNNCNGTDNFDSRNSTDNVIGNYNGIDSFGNCNSTDKVISNCNGAVTEAKVRLHSNSSHSDKQMSVLIEKNAEHEIIRETTKIRLQNLVDKHPEGIWCSELPSVYKNEYNLELEYNDLGFNNITEFVAALPNIFVVVVPPYTNKQMVLDARKSSKMTNSQSKTLASHYNFDDYVKTDPDPVPIKLSSGVCRMLIPEGVMNLNETVDLIMVTTLTCEEYIEVNISEIFTPTFFWITLRKNKKKIKMLMSDLEEFYTNQKLDSYKIPQVVLEPGLNVACLYAKKWHRGLIKKIKPDGYVMIFFYDYGTVKTYNPNDLYYLHKKFSALPAQAIACGLYNVRPIGSSEWQRDSTNAFINKVWNIPLVAIISSTNYEQNTMMITLTDTSDDLTDLHINDWMVENQFAEWGKMVCISNNFIFQHYLQYLERHGISLVKTESKKKFIDIENAVHHDMSCNSVSSPINYHAKITALNAWKAHYSYSCSSWSNETIYVYENEDKRFFDNEKISSRYKKLLVNRIVDSSEPNVNDSNNKKQNNDETVQDNALEEVQNLITSTKLDSSTEERVNLIKKKDLRVNGEPTIDIQSENDCFHSISGGHGRMEPIDWSYATNATKNNAAVLRCNSLLNRIKNLNNKMAQA